MRDSRRMRVAFPRSVMAVAIAGLAFAGTAALVLSLGTPASAYEQYSTNRTTGNCATCHGDFRAGGYVSKNDGVAWNNSLHDGHRSNMLNGDCDVCHNSSGRFPVLLKSSNGGAGFAPISCIGCHGRAETAAGDNVLGSGLRQHHYRNGVTECGNSGCHTDANPATFTVVGEKVKPPYYFTPDAAHPNKPVDPCNADGTESTVAPPLGLDNDGDNSYDLSDGDCGLPGVGDETRLSFALSGVFPNPSAGRLKVAFSLPDGRPAVLEALDVTGRRIASREVGSLGAGRHVVDLTPGKAVPAGVYVLRLTQGSRSLTAKAVVTR